VNVAALNGMCLAGGANAFCVPRVGHEKFKLFLSVTANVFLGQDILGLTRSPRLMMMETLCFRVSEVAGIMIAVIRSMLSDMRKGK
jgi:hypothetical protein